MKDQSLDVRDFTIDCNDLKMVGAVVRHKLLKSGMFWRKALTLFATMTNSMSAAPLWLR